MYLLLYFCAPLIADFYNQPELVSISRLLFIDVNPIMPKAALAKMGVCGEHLRLPLIETTEENKKALFGAMDEFEKLGY